jgi:hypothetical protein
MKKQIVSLLLFSFLLFFAGKSFGQNDSIRPVHVGLIYPLSSNGVQAAKYTNRFSLHAVAGLSRNETSVAIAGAANVIKQDASGAQIAGAINTVGRNAKGAQVAGAVNVVGNDASGLQIAGAVNYIKNHGSGYQLAGFANVAGSGSGVQVAGFSNAVTRDLKGVQVAGFLNKSGDVNSQIAGFLNVARNVKGIQLAGFLNIADSSDYPIGIFNFIKNGEKSIGLSIDETMTGLVSFRSGGRVLYGIAGVGYNFKENDRNLFAAEVGMGAHIPVARTFRINTEAINLTLSDFKKGTYMKSSLRILPAYRVGNRIELFAGPTVNYVNYSKETGQGLVDHYFWKKLRQDDFQGLFVGFTGGIQVIL